MNAKVVDIVKVEERFIFRIKLIIRLIRKLSLDAWTMPYSARTPIRIQIEATRNHKILLWLQKKIIRVAVRVIGGSNNTSGYTGKEKSCIKKKTNQLARL